jgi:hypothetical protein
MAENIESKIEKMSDSWATLLWMDFTLFKKWQALSIIGRACIDMMEYFVENTTLFNIILFAKL